MRVSLALAVSLGLAHSALAQVPDVSIVTDVRSTLQFSQKDAKTRFYDPFGRISTVTLQLILEGFYVVRLSERFARIPGDTMGKQLEYAYFEYPGLWRVGVIPARFGRGWLIREYGLGGEIRTNLLFDNLPFSIGAIDDGERRTRGVMARAGGRVGVSFASGNHFAASGTSLTAIRSPEEAPGIGRGYKTLYGVDASGRFGPWRGSFEAVSLKQGQTSLDKDEKVLDFELAYQLSPLGNEYRIGYARTLRGRSDHLRAEVEAPVDQKLSITGQFRLDSGRALYAIGLRARF